MVSVLTKHQNKIIQNETPDESGCLHAGYFKMGGRDQQYIKNDVQIGTWRTHEDGKGFRETEDNNCPTIPARAREDGSGQPVIKIDYNYGRKALNETLANEKLPNEISIVDSYNKKIQSDVSPSILTTIDSANNHHVFVPANNSKGFDIAEEEDSINFSVPTSETRRGRVGKKVSQTLDTQCNQGIYTQQRIRRLTPTEAFRLMDFNEDFIEKTINAKKYFYFQFIYSNFDINKKETLCNAKLKVVKEPQTQENLETYVLCTTKECQEMEILTTLRQKKGQKIESKESLKNVSFAIEPLVELEQKGCVINITKWKDCTETPCIEIIKKTNRVVVDISDIITEKDFIEPLWKITLEENLSEEKLFITLILLKQIMTSKIFIYAETLPNTPRYINSIVNYEKKLGKLQLSYLRMESTKQLVSDSMLYKQAGNSICVGVLAAIISKLKL